MGLFSRIYSTGAYVPPLSVSNDLLSAHIDTNDEWIRSRSGIATRHYSEGENTSDLATKVAQSILEKKNIDPLSIDLIIVATISADYTTPATACLVQANIGAENAVAFDVSAACSGFVFGLSIADKYIKSGVYQNALVIGAEVLSKMLDFEDRSTSVLFGDGAGGVFLIADDKTGILTEVMGSDGSRGHCLTAGDKLPANPLNSIEQTEDYYIHMDGKEIFNFATRQTPKCIQSLLEKSQLNKEDLKWVIPHQANIRIVEIISRKLKIPMEKFYTNLSNYGNTSSASIPIALNEMMEKGLLVEGDVIAIAGFGGGLTWGGILIQI